MAYIERAQQAAMGDETEFIGTSTGALSPVKPHHPRSASPLPPRHTDFFGDDDDEGDGREGDGIAGGPGEVHPSPSRSRSNGNLDTVVQSPRVSVLATSMFQEMSVLVETHGESSVAGMMPIVVSTLETLDESLRDLSQTQNLLDDISEDNEQLHAQFEKERKMRRDEQQLRLNAEDMYETERRENTEEMKFLRQNNRRLQKLLTDSKDQARTSEERLDRQKGENTELRSKYTRVNHALQLALRRDTRSLARRTSTSTEISVMGGVSEMGEDTISVTASLSSGVARRTSMPGLESVSPEPGPNVLIARHSRHAVQKSESVRNEQSFTEEVTSGHQVASAMVAQSGVRQQAVTSSPIHPGGRGQASLLPVDEGGNLLSSIRIQEGDEPSLQAELAANGRSSTDQQPLESDEHPATEAAQPRAVSAAFSTSAAVSASQLASSQAVAKATRLDTEDVPVFGSPRVHFAPDAANLSEESQLTASGEAAVREKRDEADEFLFGGLREDELVASGEGYGNTHSFSEELLERFVTKDGSLLDVDPGADITVMDSENLVRQIRDLDTQKNELEKVIRQRNEEITELASDREMLEQQAQSVAEVQSEKAQRITALEEALREKEQLMEAARTRRGSDDPLFPGADDNWRVDRERGRRFTRTEMSYVVKERNEYKIKYFAMKEELDDLRKQLEEPTPPPKKEKISLWRQFAALFTNPRKRSESKAPPAGELRLEPLQEPAEEETKSESITFGESRFEAYGWSLPEDMRPAVSPPLLSDGEMVHDGEAVAEEVQSKTSDLDTIPLLTHCSPVTGIEEQDRYFIASSRVFSAAAVCCTPESNPSLHVSDTVCPASLVWLCVGNSDLSRVDVVDANSPKEVVCSFPVGSSPILACACVPGAVLEGGADIHIATSGADSRTLSRAEIEKWRLNMSPAHSPARDRLHTLAAENENLSVHSGYFGSRSNSDKDPHSQPASRIMSPEDEPDGLNSDFENIELGQDETDRAPRPRTPTEYTSSEVLNRPKLLHPTMWLGAEFGALYIHSAISSWSSCLHAMKVEASILSIVYTHSKVFVSMENGRIMVFRRHVDMAWDFDNFDVIDICKYVDSDWQGSIPATAVLAVDETIWCGVGNCVVVLNVDTYELVKSFVVHPSNRSVVQRLVHWNDGVWVSVRRDSTLRLFNAVTMDHVQDIDVSQPLQSLLSLPGSQRKPSRHNLVRITALLISNGCLWVGANNGAIICLPCSATRPKLPGEDAAMVIVRSNDDGSVAVQTVAEGDDPLTGSGDECDGRKKPVIVLEEADGQAALYKLPYCDLDSARLSFHGHLHHVDVVVGAPGTMICKNREDQSGMDVSSPLTYIVSAGSGYVDFRLDTSLTSAPTRPQSERNHVIIWQVTQKNS